MNSGASSLPSNRSPDGRSCAHFRKRLLRDVDLCPAPGLNCNERIFLPESVDDRLQAQIRDQRRIERQPSFTVRAFLQNSLPVCASIENGET